MAENVLSIAEFVRQTIIQVADGLKAAQEEKREEGVKVLPNSYGDSPTPIDMDFNLIVTSIAESGDGGGLKLGIPLLCLDVSLSKGGKARIEGANRVQFKLPVSFTIYNAPNSRSPRPTRAMYNPNDF